MRYYLTKQQGNWAQISFVTKTSPIGILWEQRNESTNGDQTFQKTKVTIGNAYGLGQIIYG